MSADSTSHHCKEGLWALSPIVVFLGLYLGVSLYLNDFYSMPIAVALLVASIWALLIYRGCPLLQRIEVFSREAGNGNVLYMIWIFILAGGFATLADRTGAVEATVVMSMHLLPAEFIIPGLFIAACFISMAIGTSVGTVVALTPLAVELSGEIGGNLSFFIAVCLSGAFFGDNLSFISDTTIAATRTQNCRMNEKFKANIVIVLPAALMTLCIYLFGTFPINVPEVLPEVNMWLVVPYIAVIVLAIAGLNVTLTLITGIVLALLVAISQGTPVLELMGFIGEGIDGMGNLIIITLLASGMLGIIKAAGGIGYLLRLLSNSMRGSRGAQGVIVALVAIVNLCTANNTVAILTVGSISKDISERFGIAPRKAASLLDTGSCFVQCLIPYGAQTLFATTLAGISPTAPWSYLYYPWLLLMCLVISIVVRRRRN